MKGVYKIIFTVIGDDLSLNDYFYVENIDEIKEGLNKLFKDYNITDNECVIVEDDSIFAVGEDYDLLITIESVSIIDSNGLKGIIDGEVSVPQV